MPMAQVRNSFLKQSKELAIKSSKQLQKSSAKDSSGISIVGAKKFFCLTSLLIRFSSARQL